MQIYIIVMYGAAALVLIAFAATLGKAAWLAPRGRFRAVSASGAAMCLLLAISSLQHLLVLAAHRSIIAPQWLRLLLGPAAAVQATLAVLTGIWALVLVIRHWGHLGRAQSMVGALTDRVPATAHARQARLSSREHEVLELIRTGVLSRQRDSPGSAHLTSHRRNPRAAHPAEDRATQPPRPHAAPPHDISGLASR